MFLDEFVGGEMSVIIVVVCCWFVVLVEKMLELCLECVDVLYWVCLMYEFVTFTVFEFVTVIS